MTRRGLILLLLAFSLGTYVGTAAWPGLLDDADTTHAMAAREMLQSGNWVILHIDGIRYLEKPPLHYWLVAASYALFGPTTFATRLPLALAIAGLALMLFAFGRRFFGERAGFYAGLVMTTSLGTFLFTRIMIPEALYAFEFTAAFYLFLRAWTGSLAPRAGYWGTAALLALAMLTRSLVGVVFPLAILFLFVALTGQWRRFRDIPLLSSFLIFLAIAAPWHVLAELRVPRHPADFFWFYFLNEQVLRALGWRYPADYATVPLGLWLFAHFVWLFPWSVYAPYALAEFPRPRTWRSLDAAGQARLFLFLWSGFILAFFSWTKSRMEYYSFSAWPALAMLLGLGLARAEEQHRRWLPRLQGLLAALGALAAVILGAMLWISRGIRSTNDIATLLHRQNPELYRLSMADFLEVTPQSFADLRVQAALAAIILLAGFGAAWQLRRRGRALGSNLAVASACVAFFFTANSAYGVFEPHLSSRPAVRFIDRYLQPQDEIAIYGEIEGASSVGFYIRRRIWLYNGRYNGLEFGSDYPDAPKIFLDDRAFRAHWCSPTRVFLVVPPQQRRNALVRLPPESTYFLAEVGDKQVYTNHLVRRGEQTLAERLASGEETIRPARPALGESCASP
ncbi:MAG TPA: glycosyltransferase family 39 protein [Candidatus Acidoferrales bacterium]|nr:glycosyltransferase family 39 protein [Candidatus Acidoferrales bacterium]